MSGSMTAATNDNGHVDRFIDAAGNVIYIEPQTYTHAVAAANSAATAAVSATQSAISATSAANDSATRAEKVATDFNAAEATRVANDIKRAEATESAKSAATAASNAATAANSAASAANIAAAKTKPYFIQQNEPERSKRVNEMLWIVVNESNHIVSSFKRWDANKKGKAVYPGDTTIIGNSTIVDIEGDWTTFNLPFIG